LPHVFPWFFLLYIKYNVNTYKTTHNSRLTTYGGHKWSFVSVFVVPQNRNTHTRLPLSSRYFLYIYINFLLFSFLLLPLETDAKNVANNCHWHFWLCVWQVATGFNWLSLWFLYLLLADRPFFLARCDSNPWRWAPALVTGHWLSFWPSPLAANQHRMRRIRGRELLRSGFWREKGLLNAQQGCIER